MNREVCVLRPAVAADVPFLVEIARRSWMSAFGETAPTAFIERWKASDREPPWYAAYWPTMTVAECSGSVVGLVQPVGNEVNGLWVDPRTQGLGVGTALLRSVEREIAAAGHSTVWVTCSGYNPRALDFYKNAGYAESRRSIIELGPDLTDEVIVLERTLLDERLVEGSPGC